MGQRLLARPVGRNESGGCNIAMGAIHAVPVHYNFARIHKTLRVTPAMQSGLSDHVWSLEEIVMMADDGRQLYAEARKARPLQKAAVR